ASTHVSLFGKARRFALIHAKVLKTVASGHEQRSCSHSGFRGSQAAIEEMTSNSMLIRASLPSCSKRQLPLERIDGSGNGSGKLSTRHSSDSDTRQRELIAGAGHEIKARSSKGIGECAHSFSQQSF